MQNYIKDLRTKKNMSQEKLARLVNISLTQLRNIEKNRSIPNVITAIKISIVLKENINNIFKLEDND